MAGGKLAKVQDYRIGIKENPATSATTNQAFALTGFSFSISAKTFNFAIMKKMTTISARKTYEKKKVRRYFILSTRLVRLCVKCHHPTATLNHGTLMASSVASRGKEEA